MKTSIYPASEKRLLFDTCILGSVYNKKHPKLLEFLNYLKENYLLRINKYVYLEFIRISKDIHQKEKIENFLKNDFTTLQNPHDLFANCKEIAPLYNRFNLGKNQISIVDIINLTYLSLDLELYLITFDHQDYPLQLLDRIEIGHIDLESHILTWAIYRFSKNKFLKEYEKFQTPLKLFT